MTGLSQADVIPGIATVDRLVHSFADDHVTAQTIRTSANINNIGVVLCNRDITD